MTMRTKPELSVEMWWCGDEVCDCTKPEVLVRYPWGEPEPGVGLCRVIAEGPFISRGHGPPDKEDVDAQDAWFKEAKAWYHQEPR